RRSWQARASEARAAERACARLAFGSGNPDVGSGRRCRVARDFGRSSHMSELPNPPPNPVRPASLLESVNSPQDLKRLPLTDLPQLCAEIRAFLLQSVAVTGGHLGSNLGVVE